MTVKPRAITRTLRILYPHVDLATRGTGPGEFTVTMPATSARAMGFGRDNGCAGEWISRNLGERVHIAAVDFPPRRSYRRGPRAVITLRLGPARQAQ
jgi:hypothetical protein